MIQIDCLFFVKRYLIPLTLLVMIIGLVVLALPDQDDRLFSLSEAHGPSTLDVVGLILIFIPYGYMIFLAWRVRYRLIKFRNSPIFRWGQFLAGLGLGLIWASVMNDYSHWWVFGAVILLAVQLPLFYFTLRSEKSLHY